MELRPVRSAEHGPGSGWKSRSYATGRLPDAIYGDLQRHRLPGSAVEVDSRSPVFRKSEPRPAAFRSEEHTSELQSLRHLVCRLLLEKKNKNKKKSKEQTRWSTYKHDLQHDT